MITNDSSLWSWGSNNKGQLCHRDKEPRSKPQKTSFSNISKLSAMISDNVHWVILIFLSYQVLFPTYLQTLFILCVDLTKIYFLIQKEMYFRLGIIGMEALVLVAIYFQRIMCTAI